MEGVIKDVIVDNYICEGCKKPDIELHIFDTEFINEEQEVIGKTPFFHVRLALCSACMERYKDLYGSSPHEKMEELLKEELKVISNI